MSFESIDWDEVDEGYEAAPPVSSTALWARLRAWWEGVRRAFQH